MWTLLILGCLEEPGLAQIPVFHAPGGARVETETATLTLHEATWSVHTLRLHTAAQAALHLPPALAWVPAAQAHPGHGGDGEVWGELLGSWELDLLAGAPIELGAAQVYEGELATASLVVSSVRIQGQVDQGRRFDLVLNPEHESTGIPLELDLDAGVPGALTLSVDLAHALSFVDWQAADSDGDGALSLGDGDTENTLAFGVVSTPSLNLTWED